MERSQDYQTRKTCPHVKSLNLPKGSNDVNEMMERRKSRVSGVSRVRVQRDKGNTKSFQEGSDHFVFSWWVQRLF